MADAYLRNRQIYSAINGRATVAAADTGTVTLVTGKTSFTIYIQRISVQIVTDAAQTLTFQDSNGTPKVIESTPSSPGAGTPFVFDFGADGVALTEAKNLAMALSGAGLAANIQWEGFSKLTGATNA